jgi:hypothetical protein
MSFFRTGRTPAWALASSVLIGTGTTAVLGMATVNARYERDVSRMVFNDNLGLLDAMRRRAGLTGDSLDAELAARGDTAAEHNVLVVSVADRRLWYRVNNRVVFETRVATGSGKVLERRGAATQWKFETPRGRLVVQSKETEPAWVPPDWHYVEVARRNKLGLKNLIRGQTLDAGDGTVVAVSGNDVVRRLPDGTERPFEVSDGREIVVDGSVVVPPFGTNQRRYRGVVGSHRLNLGDGYALHGTNVPSSIGQAVSHGCVRLRNEDIETLYRIVPVGTPVYIY